jgi:hypothetical protein
MKFYYNGKKVRESKTHEYKYGVYSVSQDKIIGCSETREGAEAQITRIMADSRDALKTYEGALKALRFGSSGFDSYWGRRSTYVRFREEHTEKYFIEKIEYHKENLNRIRNTCKVVELEAIA